MNIFIKYKALWCDNFVSKSSLTVALKRELWIPNVWEDSYREEDLIFNDLCRDKKKQKNSILAFISLLQVLRTLIAQ